MREAWFSALGGRVRGARVLDLFAGSGALGLEALSRGAEHVIFVDASPAAVKTIRANLVALDAESRATVVRSDALRFLRSLDRPADLALADPPYGKGWAERLISHFCAQPFADELWVEHGSREVLSEVPSMRHRRYGDTTLTTVEKGPDDE